MRALSLSLSDRSIIYTPPVYIHVHRERERKLLLPGGGTVIHRQKPTLDDISIGSALRSHAAAAVEEPRPCLASGDSPAPPPSILMLLSRSVLLLLLSLSLSLSPLWRVTHSALYSSGRARARLLLRTAECGSSRAAGSRRTPETSAGGECAGYVYGSSPTQRAAGRRLREGGDSACDARG